MYDTMINPLTNHKVLRVHTRLGKSILKKYEKEFYKNQQGGMMMNGFTKDADAPFETCKIYNASITDKDDKDDKDHQQQLDQQ